MLVSRVLREGGGLGGKIGGNASLTEGDRRHCNLNMLSAALMHQPILTKSGGPHLYVDPAPEKVGAN